MGFFKSSQQKREELREVPDRELPNLSDERVLMLALAMLFDGLGIEDEVLVAEMRRRGGAGIMGLKEPRE